jgi:chromosome segregation ATPase
MAKAIITQKLVDETAEALLKDGVDPSIINVKARIGAGSYTTVKKYLDQWQEQQNVSNNAAPPTPPEIEAKAKDFTRLLWIRASAISEEKTASARAKANKEIAEMKQDLNDARNEIARLEALESEQSEQLKTTEASLRKTELHLAEAKTKADRLTELEKETKSLRSELTEARKEAKEQSLASATKSGEIEALKAQIQQLLSLRSPESKGGGKTAEKKKK